MLWYGVRTSNRRETPTHKSQAYRSRGTHADAIHFELQNATLWCQRSVLPTNKETKQQTKEEGTHPPHHQPPKYIDIRIWYIPNRMNRHQSIIDIAYVESGETRDRERVGRTTKKGN